MPLQPANVSVTDPIVPAIDRVKRLLFQPFDLGKWFVIGFCAWLASLGEASFHAGFNFGSPGGRRGAGVWFNQAWDFVVQNLSWIVPLALTVGVVILGWWVLCTWLSSRGRFMFLHCVALDKAEVVEPWNKFARQGNSLFLFRLVLGLVATVAALPLFAVAGLLVYRMVQDGGPEPGRVIGLMATILAVVVVSLTFFVISKLTTDFVVPIMFLRARACRESWGEVLSVLSANAGRFILYLLFQIVLAIAMGMIVLGLVLGTCCIAGCVLILPYLGTVLLLPLLMFQRAYSAFYLAQFGREYDVFAGPEPMAPATPSVT
ncbi:MAG: hypothetical protein L0Z50_06820 [Verrucomicrobiales bacterium]|nr:hypothetical protein [Verrucomicrobiales bacterium]